MRKMTPEIALHIVALDTAVESMTQLLTYPNTRDADTIYRDIEILKKLKLKIYETTKK